MIVRIGDTLSAVVRDTCGTPGDGREDSVRMVSGLPPPTSAEGKRRLPGDQHGRWQQRGCGSAAIGYQGGQWTRMRSTRTASRQPGRVGRIPRAGDPRDGARLGLSTRVGQREKPARHRLASVGRLEHSKTTEGNTTATDFDPQSIMNYSYDEGCPLARPFRLSAWDIVGAQHGLRSTCARFAGFFRGQLLDVPQPYQSGKFRYRSPSVRARTTKSGVSRDGLAFSLLRHRTRT
jgi:hypothetical protein